MKQLLKRQPRALSGWVFFNTHGRHFSSRRVNTVWQSAATKAGLKITLYEATRHSFVSQAISSGVPERMIGDFLGHKHASTTRRYAKMKADTLRTVVETLESQLAD